MSSTRLKTQLDVTEHLLADAGIKWIPEQILIKYQD